mgnify:CR=1 FL=1
MDRLLPKQGRRNVWGQGDLFPLLLTEFRFFTFNFPFDLEGFLNLKLFLRSDNLQYDMLICWFSGTNDSSTKRLMFQALFFS